MKKSVIFPLVLLAYLAAMAWIGRSRLTEGDYLYYFGVIGVSLLIIVLLFFALRRKEKLQQRREDEQYSRYEEAGKDPNEQ